MSDNEYKFATFERDPEQWRDLLTNRGADATSLAMLFCLAQHSDAGYAGAMELVFKLLKKESGGYEVNNVSAWLCSSVKKCMYNLQS